jgi:hypothetical protein
VQIKSYGFRRDAEPRLVDPNWIRVPWVASGMGPTVGATVGSSWNRHFACPAQTSPFGNAFSPVVLGISLWRGQRPTDAEAVPTGSRLEDLAARMSQTPSRVGHE